MSISRINTFSNNIKFRNNSNVKENVPDKASPYVDLPFTKRLNYHPLVVGGLNGLCWFGVGLFLNKGFTKLLKLPNNKLVSIVTSGALALLMGNDAYKVAKSMRKQA